MAGALHRSRKRESAALGSERQRRCGTTPHLAPRLRLERNNQRVDWSSNLQGRGMRYLLVLLLAGCTATQWSKQDATAADEGRDFEECRQIAKPDPAIAAIFGVFGAVGVFFGVNHT